MADTVSHSFLLPLEEPEYHPSLLNEVQICEFFFRAALLTSEPFHSDALAQTPPCSRILKSLCVTLIASLLYWDSSASRSRTTYLEEVLASQTALYNTPSDFCRSSSVSHSIRFTSSFDQISFCSTANPFSDLSLTLTSEFFTCISYIHSSSQWRTFSTNPSQLQF